MRPSLDSSYIARRIMDQSAQSRANVFDHQHGDHLAATTDSSRRVDATLAMANDNGSRTAQPAERQYASRLLAPAPAATHSLGVSHRQAFQTSPTVDLSSTQSHLGGDRFYHGAGTASYGEENIDPNLETISGPVAFTYGSHPQRSEAKTHSAAPEGLDDDQSGEEDQDEDVEMDDDDLGDDPLLAMQNNLSTFEDSVRSFVGAGSEKSLFKQFGEEDQAAQPKRIIRRGPRKPAEPTGDVKLRLSAAGDAFMSGRLDEALDYVNDAIRINSEIYRAWSLLSEILRERGEYKQSLLAMVCAAHLQPKLFDVWLQCGRFALELLEEQPEDAEDTLRIAILTFSQAIKIQPDNIGARQTRAALYLTRQSFRYAINEYKYLVEKSPYDVNALRGLVDASVQFAEHHKKAARGHRETARDLYRHCIDYYLSEVPSGLNDPGLPFEWDDVFIYVALLIDLAQWKDALEAARTLSRWLLGRKDEHYWDEFDDDREWDADETRRGQVPFFDVDKFPTLVYGAAIPLRLRIALAVCRLHLDRENDDEAMQHLNWLDPEDVEKNEEDADLFLQAANALYDTGRLVKALPYYEPLRELPDLLDPTAMYKAGRCYLEANDMRLAEQCFTSALDSEDTPHYTRINAGYELAKMYERAKKKADAFRVVQEAMAIENDREASADSGAESEGLADESHRMKLMQKYLRKGTRKPRERRPPGERRTRAPGSRPRQNRKLLFALPEDRLIEENKRSEFLRGKWEVVRNKQLGSREGPSEVWLEAAKDLVDDFRGFKAFYPWDRYLTHMGLRKDDASPSSSNPLLLQMAQRLREDDDVQPSAGYVPKLKEKTVSYRDVVFSDWLDLFLEFALALAHQGRIREAYAVLESAMGANVFSESIEDKFIINIAIATCAIRGRDEAKCVEVARAILSMYTFSSDGYRLYAALGRLCNACAAWYADARVQKFTLRQIKIMDTALIPSEERPRGLSSYDPKAYPGKDLDAQLLMLYGHILFISNSFTFALNYFVRAHALDPDNLMINISIGQAYLHYALKRQAENRQHHIAQGFAFLHKYYDAKLAQATASYQRQEAHYNLARSYHAVGLGHLAGEYYRRVFREIESEGGVGDGEQDLAREAAYNLQLCCLVGGDLEGMREIGERWLVM